MASKKREELFGTPTKLLIEVHVADDPTAGERQAKSVSFDLVYHITHSLLNTW
jgi:hypothetical protein